MTNRKDGRVIQLQKALKLKVPFVHKNENCGRTHTEVPAGARAMIDDECDLFNGIQLPCPCGSHSTIYWSQVVIEGSLLEAAEEVEALLNNDELTMASNKFLDGEITKEELHAEISRLTGWAKVRKAA